MIAAIVPREVLDQFRRPRGALGHLAGWIMARRPSNRERNLWTLDLLEVEPDHRVLEIGFGPGYAIEQLSKRLPDGRITGIDHSELMVRQARRRNLSTIRRGQVELRCGSVETLGTLEGPFDRVFSANVSQFWKDRGAVFREILRLLAPGGRAVTTYQPRHPGASDQDAVSYGEAIVREMRAAGFGEASLESGPAEPVLTVSAVGVRP